MKELVKNLLPIKTKVHLKKIRDIRILKESYNRDYLRYKKNSYHFSDTDNFEHLRSQITFYYHSIEKGFTNINFRPLFGKTAIDNLFLNLDKYISCNYSLDDYRYLTALSTLKRYIEIHEDMGYEIEDIRIKLEKYPDSLTNEIRGGEITIEKSDVLDSLSYDFKNFSNSRHSVRNFADAPLDISTILKAIDLSKNAPSVCNRQSWNVYVVKNKQIVKDVLINQGGLNGFGQNIDSILAISCDTKYMGSWHERNQSFIDGGIYSMNLLYALHYNGIASCPLNADLKIIQEKNIRNLLKINESENIIMFIAIGNYQEEYKITESLRDPINDHIIEVY